MRDIGDRGGRAISIQGDVSVKADVTVMFERVESGFGRLIGVVHNAGIVAPPVAAFRDGCSTAQRMFTVNTFGAYLVARESATAFGRNEWHRWRCDR